MWSKIHESSYNNLFVNPKPRILIIHNFTNRRVAMDLESEVVSKNEMMGYIIPFLNTANGRFDYEKIKIYEGKKIIIFPEGILKDANLEIVPLPGLKKLVIKVYESFLTDIFSIA